MRLTTLAVTCTGSAELNALPTDCCRISSLRLTMCCCPIRETLILGRRFPNFTNPVLAHRFSRILLELQALSCARFTLFAVVWPAIESAIDRQKEIGVACGRCRESRTQPHNLDQPERARSAASGIRRLQVFQLSAWKRLARASWPLLRPARTFSVRGPMEPTDWNCFLALPNGIR